MTTLDFDLIILDSFGHSTKRSFFKTARTDNSCDSDEFVAGLKDSFNRLRPLFDSNSLDEINSKPVDFSGWVEAFDPMDRRLMIAIVINGNKEFYIINYTYILNLEEELNKYYQYVSDDEKRIKDSGKDMLPDHSELLKALAGYICKIKPIDFSFLIVNKYLEEGTEQALWNGIPADAYRFIDHIGMKRACFNRYFKLKGYSELKVHHRQLVKGTKIRTESQINDILNDLLKK